MRLDGSGGSTTARAGRAWGITLAVGAFWMLAELGLIAASGRGLVPALLIERFAALLPYQLLLFAGLGVGVAALSLAVRSRPTVDVAVAAGVASTAILGARVGEGLLRTSGAASALLGVLCVAAALALWLGLLLHLGRWLPQHLRRLWPVAASAGWSIFFIASMHRSGPAIGMWKAGPATLVQHLEPLDAGLALAVTALVLALGALPRGSLRAPSTLALLVAPPVLLLLLGPPARSGTGDAAASRPGGLPDVLVVLIDTLRFDHLGANVGREGLTPELDAIARESIVFQRGFSPGNYTKLALPGIHTGLPFTATGTPLPERVQTLAEALRARGYRTLGISTNPFVARQFGYHQGFDVFLDPAATSDFLVVNFLQILGQLLPGPAYRAGLVRSSLYYPPATQLRQRALSLLDASAGPTFLYLHTMDPHGPYLPPHDVLPADFSFDDFYPYFEFDHLKQKGVLNTPEFAPHLRNLRQRYEGEVRLTDRELGALVRSLRERGRWDEMLVWVLSDHGECFGEHDHAGHTGSNVTTTLTRVPFLLKLPRSMQVEPRVEQSVVSTADVLPTTLALLEAPVPEALLGRDLSPLVLSRRRDPGRVTLTYAAEKGVDIYSLVRWPWKLDVRIPRKSGGVTRALFNLETDPDELADVAAEHAEVIASLEPSLEPWKRDSGARDDLYPDVDAETREALRKLGYLDGS